MSKGERYGKYGSNRAGTPHTLKPADWGDKREFKGSELSIYIFRDPRTGFVWHIHAPNLETAQAQAEPRGLRYYRKKGRKSKK